MARQALPMFSNLFSDAIFTKQRKRIRCCVAASTLVRCHGPIFQAAVQDVGDLAIAILLHICQHALLYLIYGAIVHPRQWRCECLIAGLRNGREGLQLTDESYAAELNRGTPEERLRQEGIVLPPAPAPLGAYEPWVITGSLVMTSGQFSWVDGKLAFVGRIGGEVSPADAYLACRIAATNAIAQLKAAVGSLERISRIVRVEGTMQVAPGFQDHPAALNGASDLINKVFGSKGRHSRMIYTNPEMPLNAPVLIVLFAEIEN